MSIDRLNLLPEKSPLNYKFWMHEITFSAVVITVLYILVSFAVLKTVHHYQEKRLTEIKQEQKRIKVSLEKAGLAAAASEAFAAKEGSIRGLLTNRITWSNLLKELSLVTPKGVWMTGFKTQLSEKGTKSIIIQGEAYSQKEVMSFFHHLKKSLYLQSSEFRSSERVPASTPTIFKFEIESWLR